MILVLRSWRQANQVFKTNFSYIVKLKPVWGMQKHEMVSQNKKINYPSNCLDLFQEYRGWIEATETWFPTVADHETGFIIVIFIDEGWEGKEN